MNPLLKKLENENNLSISRLKEIFRELAKQSHPDLVEDNELFLKLKDYYDEAYELIEKSKNGGNYPLADTSNSLIDALEKMYLFTFNCHQIEYLERAIFESEKTNLELGKLLARLRNNLRNDICAISRKKYNTLLEYLGHYCSNKKGIGNFSRKQFESYEKDLKPSGSVRDKEMRENIYKIFSWLKNDII